MRSKPVGVLIIFIIIASALASYYYAFDGFRSNEERQELAKKVVAGGEPRYEPLKNMGLDGAEYYEVRQLWNHKRFTQHGVANVL
jgi:hypothetical protein